MKTTAIILAAGQGTRMKSDIPKVLHPVCEKPMVWHARQAVTSASTEKPVMVIGHGADAIQHILLFKKKDWERDTRYNKQNPN